jgi:hypothetical protein
MTDTPRRIDIGFQGGQVLSARVAQDVLDGFREALSDSSSARWYDLQTADSEIHVDLAQVVYVRLDTDEQRVGF